MAETEPQLRRKILHCGEVLLDVPVPATRTDIPEHRREDRRRVFDALMDLVEKEEIDLVLFDGALTDNRYATNDTLEFLIGEFSRCPNCQFVLSPAAADCFGGNRIYFSGRLPHNVHVFAEEILSRFDFDDIGVTVYGWAFTEKEHRFSPLTRKRISDTSRLNLICGSCVLDDPESTACPVPSAEIERFGAHYAALGGNYTGFTKIGDTAAAFGGKLDVSDFGGDSVGGVNEIVACKTDAGWEIFPQRIRMGEYRYETVLLDISHATDKDEVAARIRAALEEKEHDKNTAARVVLTGMVPPSLPSPAAPDADACGYFSVQILDETLPIDRTEMLMRDMSAKGELFRHLLPAMQGEDKEAALAAARTFRTGYAALCGTDFTGN